MGTLRGRSRGSLVMSRHLHEWVVSPRCSAPNGDFVSGIINSCLLMVQSNLNRFCVPESRSFYAKNQKGDPMSSLSGDTR